MRRTLFLLIPVLLLSCAPKEKHSSNRTGEPVSTRLTSPNDVVQYLDDLFTSQLKWTPIPCPDQKPAVGKSVQHCFVAQEEPEALLPAVQRLMTQRGKAGMPWRQDFGFWVSDYTMPSTPTSGVLVSLIAPGVSVDFRHDPKLKDHGTVAWFILDQDEPSGEGSAQ